MVKAVRLMNSVVMSLYRLSGGRVANRMQKAPILLLTTTGAKSGKKRTNPVLFIVDGPNYVTVASAGGSPRNPSWFANLMKHPEATIRIKNESRRIRARKANPTERERLWPMLTSVYSGYSDYSKKTTREIPVVIMEPVDGGQKRPI
jgi:F420H(2)-dependent quinone reductase